MFKLNRKLEYALMALKHMIGKRPGELTAAKEIAEQYHCSFDTISRVLQGLAQKGWLQSVQGASGGYLLIRDLKKLSFYDLTKAVMGPVEIARCLSSNCEIQNQCNISNPVKHFNDHLVNFYKNLNLWELLADSKNLKKRNFESPRPEPNKVENLNQWPTHFLESLHD